jgi:hypothetical protein
MQQKCYNTEEKHRFHDLLVLWDLAEWSERCANGPKVADQAPAVAVLTLCSYLLLTARDSST